MSSPTFPPLTPNPQQLLAEELRALRARVESGKVDKFRVEQVLEIPGTATLVDQGLITSQPIGGDGYAVEIVSLDTGRWPGLRFRIPSSWTNYDAGNSEGNGPASIASVSFPAGDLSSRAAVQIRSPEPPADGWTGFIYVIPSLDIANEPARAWAYRQMVAGPGGTWVSSKDQVNYSFDLGEQDTGFFHPADDTLATAIAGTEVSRVTATRTDFNRGGHSFITLPVKTSTGDPSSPQEGDMYANTTDNVLRLYVDAAWVTVASW